MSAATCPNCGAPLRSPAAGPICSACLFKVGLQGPSAAPATMAETIEHFPSAGTFEPPVERRLPEPGERFGGYEIVRTLGKGGMGAVYEADQLETGRRVALKVLKHSLDSQEARKRFLREGRLAASVNHPHSVYVFGTEEIEGTPAIAMELVSGGTLQELVKRDGPLPIGRAVDIVLQIIAGLEAAQKLGVLHRDIKPANCFVDADGSVKIGDFGLSISTAPRGESDVTRAGSFLGTPAFSSPEQLRGDELNVRSDMYSVGVTLYYLLTGHTPFEADNMIKLLATVLETSPESPKKLRPEIPQGLANVVLRCLQKQPTDRFRDYDALRQALIPFKSTAPTAATLGLRMVAMGIDAIILMPLVLILEYVLVRDVNELTGLQRNYGWLAAGLLLVDTLFRISYFAICEGIWGKSPGKFACRLKVVGRDRMPPGIPRAFLRASILYAIVTTPYWLRFVLPVENSAIVIWGAQLAGLLLLVANFSTARRANGFAGWHDLGSGTHVITPEAWQARPALNAAPDQTAAAANSPRIGPYYVLRKIAGENQGDWTLAYDTRLLRHVWIRYLAAGAPAVDPAHRGLGRIGRLRWLMGVRSPDENWDAYEAPSGVALLDLLHERSAWKAVRFWLLDLAEELSIAAKSGTVPAELGLARVWITADGRAKLLDFPAPGVEPLDRQQLLPWEATKQDTIEQSFLQQVATAALEGRIPDQQPSGAPAVPLPIHVREFLTSLPQQPNLKPCLETLQASTRRTAEISRSQRGLVTLGCNLPSLFYGFIALMIPLVIANIESNHPQIMELRTNLTFLDVLEFKKQAVVPPEKFTPQIAAMETSIAYRFGDTVRDSKEWNSAVARQFLTSKDRARAEKIVADHGHVTAEEYGAAKAILESSTDFKDHRDFGQALQAAFQFFGLFLVVGSLVWAAFFSIAAALITRRGLLLWAVGIDFVRADGTPASRGRLLWRSIITWSPLFLVPVLIALIVPALQVSSGAGTGSVFVVFVAFGLMYVMLAVGSTALPVRGIPDRIAGTWPVPR